MIKCFSLASLRQQISYRLSFRLARIRDTDRFIVSYPRSGSTWVRTVLSNIIVPDADSDPSVFNQIIPGTSIRTLRTIHRLQSPRLISSHTWYRSEVPLAVYIVRDGRDSLISYYHYLVTRLHREESFSDFFESYCAGREGQRWHENVESWLSQGAAAMRERLLIVRFEDLRADPERRFGEISRFLDIQATGEEIRRAADSASVERMAAMERNRRTDQYTKDGAFYRGGRSGEWRERMSADMIERFEQMSRSALLMAGYKLGAEELGEHGSRS
jgi:hypothetical protein